MYLIVYVTLTVINRIFILVPFKSSLCNSFEDRAPAGPDLQVNRTISQNPAMHQTNIPQCTTLWQKYAHMCTFLLQCGALWDMRLVHCGICEIGILEQLYCMSGYKVSCSDKDRDANCVHKNYSFNWQSITINGNIPYSLSSSASFPSVPNLLFRRSFLPHLYQTRES